MTRPAPAILILAAGASSRMRGGDKLQEPVDGTPLILRAVRAACATVSEVIVALPPNSARRAWLGDSPATLLEVPDREMSASIRAGVIACRAPALLIHLADMPEIGAPELARMVAAWREGKATILRAATADGQLGQPVVFDRCHFEALTRLSGDTGARDLLRQNAVEIVTLPGRAALTDLDTPEDWAEWRARTGR
ncbi:nucleotidyltransferase family protein [Jannaschia pohangensis]|uniref:CTP:molybdopterin cytidylyltransferase MocA n=1 Tax=Jannaschia pohangensis TaxID=390807 RepID=A0A1I3GP93_9RHOB|nr:nucleotidyltransferase family protein [Jannaschia pohangensis]SFI25315.1 CTP:molybdopterin cytidylyltransferase MocA [Jannaschia pohangensis]